MPQATLTLTVPDDVWIGEISRNYPDSCFRVLSAFPKEESGVCLVELTAPELAAVVRAIHEEETVSDLELLQRHDDTVLLQFETTDPHLLFPIVGSGIPLELPFDLVAGQAEWELTTPREKLSTLGDQLDAFDITYRVDQIRHYVEPDPLLTDKQEEVVSAAVERGYYDTPRECTLTELAEDLDVAKSTCSETLHRAEERIVKQYFQDHLE